MTILLQEKYLCIETGNLLLCFKCHFLDEVQVYNGFQFRYCESVRFMLNHMWLRGWANPPRTTTNCYSREWESDAVLKFNTTEMRHDEIRNKQAYRQQPDLNLWIGVTNYWRNSTVTFRGHEWRQMLVINWSNSDKQ